MSLINPSTTAERAEGPTIVLAPPGDASTMYPETGEEPAPAGADQVTMADALLATAETLPGADGGAQLAARRGGPQGAAGLDGAEALPMPTELVALTMKVSGVPAPSPVTVAVSVDPPTVTTGPLGLVETW